LSKRIAGIALGLLFAILLAEGIYFVAHGRFNIDEGMHLNAGRLVLEEGLLPYRDFPFSQGPGAPLYYGFFGALFGTSLLVGRAASLLLNMAGVGLMVWFAGRLGGHSARLLVVLWSLVNLPAVWTYAQVRTEPPSLPLTVAAAIVLCLPKRSALAWSIAPCLLVWATSVRLTTAVPLIGVCVWVAYELRRSPRCLLACAAIVGANGVLAALPMLAFPTESVFHILTAQLGRTERFNMGDYPFSQRFWFFLEAHTSFQPILALTVVPLYAIFREWRRGWRLRGFSVEDPVSVLVCLISMALLSYAPHLFFSIGFFHYFVTASVLLSLAIAIAIPMVVAECGRSRIPVVVAIFVVWGAAAMMSFDGLGRWVFRLSPTIATFDELRTEMHRLSPARCTMMTFETHIAVETGCDVMPGLEYSFFSFFPEMPDAEAEVHGVLTRSLLIDRIERDRPEFVALTSRAVEQITQRAEDRSGETRTLRGERKRVERELRARARSGRHGRGGVRMLDVMDGRYELLGELTLPVGPIHEFWTRVSVYVRSDLLESAADE